METLGNKLLDPSERRLRRWAEAALDRYGHPPTDMEWVTDPLIKIAWKMDRKVAFEHQLKLSLFADEAHRKRRSQPPQ